MFTELNLCKKEVFWATKRKSWTSPAHKKESTHTFTYIHSRNNELTDTKHAKADNRKIKTKRTKTQQIAYGDNKFESSSENSWYTRADEILNNNNNNGIQWIVVINLLELRVCLCGSMYLSLNFYAATATKITI